MKLTTTLQKIATSSSVVFGYATAYLELWAKYNSQDINNNTSNCTFETRLIVSGGYIGDYSGASYSLSADAITVNKSLGTGNFRTRVISTDSGTVKHASDGSKSFTANSSVWFGAWGKGISVSSSVSLPKIPRQANLTSATDFNDEENPKITYSNPAGNSVTSLQACIKATGITIPYRDVSKTGKSYTFNLTDDERNSLRNVCTSNSMTVKFILETVIGNNTYHSELSKVFTIVNANPVFSNFTYKDVNTTVTNITGNNQIFLTGISTLQVTISSANKMIAQKGATPDLYTMSCDGMYHMAKYQTGDIVATWGSKFKTAGVKRLEVRAHDSRGNSTPVEKNITVLPYAQPNIYITAERLNDFENQTTIKCKGTYSKVEINGTAKNTIKNVEYRIREVNGTWGSWTKLSFTVDTAKAEYTCNNIIKDLDNTRAYEVAIRVTDAFGTYGNIEPVDIGAPLFFVSDNLQCIARNCMPPASAKPGTSWFKGEDGVIKQDAGYEMPVGSIYLSVNDINPSKWFGGTWEQIAKGRTLVGVDPSQAEFNTVKKTGGSKYLQKHSHSASYTSDNAPAIYPNWGNLTGWGVKAEYVSGTGGTWHSGDSGTGESGNLQPYFTCYIWCRTA